LGGVRCHLRLSGSSGQSQLFPILRGARRCSSANGVRMGTHTGQIMIDFIPQEPDEPELTADEIEAATISKPMSATMSVTEAARVLGISRTTAYEAVRDGSLRSIRLRRRIVIPRAGDRRTQRTNLARSQTVSTQTSRTIRCFHRKLPVCRNSLRLLTGDQRAATERANVEGCQSSRSRAEARRPAPGSG
jgi:excisionase family DNA binding protein